MRIAYCAHVRLPSERAHGHQIAQVCDAMVQLGHDVTLFAPTRQSAIKEDYHTYYDADKAVQVKYLPSFDQHTLPIGKGFIGLWFANISLRRAFRKAISEGEFDLIYTRSAALISALIDSDSSVIFELHQLPRRNRKKFVRDCNGCKLVVCLTSIMREELLQWGVDESRLVVAGDAVDLQRFKNLPSVHEARQLLGILTNRIVVGYIGRLKTLGMDKGVSDILHSLADLKNDSQFFGLIVGGPEDDKKEYEVLAQSLGLTEQDVFFTGSVPASMVPTALAACDVLAMPFPDKPHYRKHMSPLKMFEYMAANRIILTSDLPTVRDVLSEETAVFCEPDNINSLTHALCFIVANPKDVEDRVNAANALVQDHSWQKRMDRILKVVGSS